MLSLHNIEKGERMHVLRLPRLSASLFHTKRMTRISAAEGRRILKNVGQIAALSEAETVNEQ